MLVPLAGLAIFFAGFLIIMAIDAYRFREIGRLWRLARLAALATGLSGVAVWLAATRPDRPPTWQSNGFSAPGWRCEPVPYAKVCFREPTSKLNETVAS
ncbi:MAG TPA: hypothetical protein VFA50_02020 [Stellaceae bacterium]|nr:hypothetical protein [Stellaceae bacterium]